ncbi:hypothetical protein WMF38_43285 [Sorangium sp. So ce118]
MISNKMPLRSQDLVNQTALTLPEREMMDMFTFGNVDIDVDQDNSSTIYGDDNQVNQQNQSVIDMDCWQWAFALATYSDYTEVEAEEAYQDCRLEKDIDQESDQEDEDNKDKKDDRDHEPPR